MMTQFLFICFITLLMAAILRHPAVCAAGAASGLLVWFDSVLPSLFPFMVLTGLLIQMNAPCLLSQKLKKVKLFCRVPVSFLFAAMTGLLCGYPMGIRTVCELRESNQLSRKQASLLISFVNQPGPMFVLGYCVPLCGANSAKARLFIIAFYGSVVLTALIAGLCMWIFSLTYGKPRCSARESRKRDSFLPKRKSDDTDRTSEPVSFVSERNLSVFRLFEDTILSSMTVLVKIGGYMMLFSLIYALIEELLPSYPRLLLMIGGLLEMTSGIAKVSVLSGTLAPYYILGFLSFGGLCVTAQSFSLGKLETREQLYYLVWKSVQAVLAIPIFFLLNTYFPT